MALAFCGEIQSEGSDSQSWSVSSRTPESIDQEQGETVGESARKNVAAKRQVGTAASVVLGLLARGVQLGAALLLLVHWASHGCLLSSPYISPPAFTSLCRCGWGKLMAPRSSDAF